MPTAQFGNHAISYAAADDALAWHLDWHFGRLPTTSSPPDLRVGLGPERVAVPTDVFPMVDGPVERWLDEDALVLRHETGVTGRADDAHVAIDTSRLDPSDWRPSRQLLFNALSWWLERRGVALLHGGLVGRAGEAVLVFGGTGSGKSTIAAAALAHGWEVYADDLVAVRMVDDEVHVTGLPKRMMVAPELASALDAHEAVPLSGDARGRLVLPPSALGVGTHRLRGLVVAGHDAGPGRLKALDHGERLPVVARSSVESVRPAALRRQLGVLSAVAGLPGHRLAHARRPEGRLAAAARLLQQAWRQHEPGGATDRAAVQ